MNTEMFSDISVHEMKVTLPHCDVFVSKMANFQLSRLALANF